MSIRIVHYLESSKCVTVDKHNFEKVLSSLCSDSFGNIFGNLSEQSRTEESRESSYRFFISDDNEVISVTFPTPVIRDNLDGW